MTPTVRTRRRNALALAVSIPLLLTACSSASATAESPESAPAASATPRGEMTISRADERPTSPGPAENFSGTVNVTMLSEANESIPASTGEVTFDAGARSAWHSHPKGQALIVTDGTGWVQARGESRQEMHAGDVIWTPPGVEHWHGATATTSVTHIALTGVVDDVNANWGPLVTDDEYSNG